MRLGDLDRIAQDVRDNNIENYYKQDWTSSQIVTLLENAPTIDAVPVVRCRECVHSSMPSGFTQRYGKLGTLSCHFGPCNRRNVNENDFCSYGQRKESELD